MNEMLKFDMPKEQPNIIKVLGVGGGGSNAVTHMFEQGIKDVDFFICNTDCQALMNSPVPNKIQIGKTGLGAGSRPEVGREAAMEKKEELRKILDDGTAMLFITAGMGGGTGTGAAPVIAEIARELGILTVGIVTRPFGFEGRKRQQFADNGIEELKKLVDTILVICNDKLLDLQGDMKAGQAFAKANNVVTTAAKGIAEIITGIGHINVDFQDIKTVMQNSGKAIMGAGIANGPSRALDATQMALSSPLLDDTDIKGADNILLYLNYGTEEISIEELNEITDYVTNQAGDKVNLILGYGEDKRLSDEIAITVIATGFDKTPIVKYDLDTQPKNKPIAPPAQPENIEPETEVKLKTVEPETEVPASSFPDLKLHFQVPAQVSAPPQLTFIPVQQEPEIQNEITVKESDVPSEIVVPSEPEPVVQDAIPNFDNLQQERVNKLKSISMQLYSSSNIEALEREPAYVRRNVELSNGIPQGNETNVSRFTLNNDTQQGGGLRENNTFLHDNVD